MVADVHEIEFRPQEGGEGPGGMGGEARERAQRQFRRHRETVGMVAPPIAGDRRIDREHQRVESGLPAARDQLLGEAPILEDIDLEDFRPQVLGERFESGARHCRQAVADPGALRGAGHGGLGGSMEQLVHAGRRQDQRPGYVTAEDTCRRPDRRHVVEDVRHDLQVIEGPGVAAQRDLVVGTAINVVENRPGQSTASDQPQVRDAVRVIEASPRCH